MGKKVLRPGFTTGACAAAAARGAALMLRDQRLCTDVELLLPAGFAATFRLEGQRFDRREAACYVVKDAGDDPDVTHGAEVHAVVRREPRTADQPALLIEGGPGIGRVTKPGLAVKVGEWAINPVPRQMIGSAVTEVFPDLPGADRLRVTLSIPDGERRAAKTLNERLGIIGGLSILGTTGVVRPLSHQAWTDTLDAALDVARAVGCDRVALSTGRTSEQAAQQELPLPEEAFIMMGDFVAYTLEACRRRGFAGIVLAAQFAKLVKIACGHDQTHVRNSRLDLRQLALWGRELGLDGSTLKKLEFANTAREVFLELGPDHPLIGRVAQLGLARMAERAPGIDLGILLVDYAGNVPRCFGPAQLFAQGRIP